VTALVVHDMTNLLPSKIHLTVPRRFHKRPPLVCKLHKAELREDDIEGSEEFRVTTPLRTLLDAAISPDVPQDEVSYAVEVALERGLVRRSVLTKAVERSPAMQRLRSSIEA
jgi:predicted transcriptional regulator of viral defense system